MDYLEALKFLDQHVNHEATAGRIHGLSLDAMRGLVQIMGDPQSDFQSIHITGTNGKGSVSTMTSSLLKAAGLKVGTYCSPHVDTVRERLKINGEMISEEQFGDLIGELAPFAENTVEKSSYFELLTAASFLWFSNEAVDVAVVEVGLLGRFDATNVVESDVSVVTNVGRDHTDGADGWRRAVASEKAGIITSGRPLLLGETSVETLDLFIRENPDPLLMKGEAFGVLSSAQAVGGQLLDVWSISGRHDEVFIPLFGDHQSENAALALATVETFLGAPLAEEIIEEGMSTVSLPGRLEVVSANPITIFDGAHNQDASKALSATVQDVFPETRRIVVLGMLGPREPAEVINEIVSLHPEMVICCTIPSARAIPGEILAEIVQATGVDAEVVEDPNDAMERALALSTDEDLILVTGSFYLISVVRSSFVSD